jgi:hypothetical protein
LSRVSTSFVAGVKAVDGRVKPGQDEDGRANSSNFAAAKFPPDSPAPLQERDGRILPILPG